MIVRAFTSKLFISCLTRASNAISTAKAMRVMRAAKNEMRDARRVTVKWVDRERRNATKETPAATGWMTKPRVQAERTSAVSPFVGDLTEKV